jgi:phospholipid transport system substrate-binding protein
MTVLKFASRSLSRRRTLIASFLFAFLGWVIPPGTAQATTLKKSAKGAPSQGKVPEEAPSSPSVAPSLPPPGTSPMAELRKSNGALKKLFQKQPPSWSPESDAKRSDMRKIVGGFLDFEELAHRSLARHWDGLTPKQRSEFVAVLRDLIERNYIKQVHGQPNYDLRFEKETVTGSEAMVVATLDSQSNGKKVSVDMEYKLLYKGSHWLVFDVVTDEQSMLENYRAEFNKIINKESFDALVKRMKKRLETTE